MQQIFTSIHETTKQICQPNPKLYPDPSIRQLFWNRNVTNIYTNIAFLISYPIFAFFFKSGLFLNLMIMGTSLFLLISFLLLCRSYLWIFNVLYVFVSFILGFIGLEMIRDAVYFHIGINFVLLVAMTIRTGDTRLAMLAGIAQVFTFLTKLKEKFIILLEEEDPEVFADKFVKITLFFFFIMLMVSLGLVKDLEKRSIELSKAKSALENALEQQKTFIFSFSHELRNPINSLLGNLQLVLQGETLTPKAQEMIRIAKVCGEILLHNINNVLDTGKHEMGKLEVNPVSTQLHELFQRTWSIYSELLRQKKLQSQLRIEKGMPPVVKVDSHKLNQILSNLIGNSIKFTEKGSVTVTVKWLKHRHEVNDKCFEPIPYDDMDEGLFEKEENFCTMNECRFSESIPGVFKLSQNDRDLDEKKPSGIDYNEVIETRGVLKIIVKDTGPGMKEEALEKLFKKFSQVSENVSQRQIGTGLGLFITKEICQAMDGKVCAYSKLGTGTTFIVCIPALALPLNTRQRADSTSILNELTTKRLKAIVADDSPFNVSLTCNYFSQFGASVVSVAYNGYDAYMQYREARMYGGEIDIVTLDIDMPVMDGRKACDKIRKYEKKNNLKPVLIVLISGNYDHEQIDEYINGRKGHRADYFLRKPVSFSDFNRAIFNLVVPQ